MLDIETKNRINTARDILVGKVPDPKSQVEQITIALIYKFMDDMDLEAEELGGKRTFFVNGFSKYSWRKIFDPKLSGYELLNLYGEAITKMDTNPGVPKLFRDIFKNAYLPYRDPETLKSFLKVINEFEYTHSEKLGDAFEYLLSVLGSQGDAGQFRTPRHIIDFMVAIIDPQKHETILDPACGTSGFLISSYRHIIKHNSSNFNPADNGHAQESQGVNDRILNSNGYTGDLLSANDRKKLANNIYGFDISPDMVRLSLVNMYLHGIKEPHISEYDTLTSEDHWNHFSDVILANPPFMSPKGGIRPHKRFSVLSNRSEVLFVDYIAEHLTSNGRAAVIVPEGIIFQSGNAYKQLRKMLVEEYLVGVISLPAGIFQPYSGVKTSILWLDKTLAKKTDKILFVKINNDGYDLGAQRRAIKQNDLPIVLKIILTYKKSLIDGNLNDPHFLQVTRKEISQTPEYFLNAERYRVVQAKNDRVQWTEIKKLTEFMTDGNWIESIDQSEDGIRLIQTGNIGIGEFKEKGEKARYISLETFNRLKCTEVFKGDVLVSRLPDPVGRACIVPTLPSKAITAVDCTVIRFNKERMLPELFNFYCRSDHYYKQIHPFLTGSSRSRISRKNLESVRIPVPDMSEQVSIVSELDSYQKIIDGARMVVENYKPRIDIDPEWEMVELGDNRHFRIEAGGTPSSSNDSYWNGNINWATLVDLPQSDYISTIVSTTRKITEAGLKNSAAILIQAESIVVSTRATIGRVAINKVPLATNQGFKNVIVTNKAVLPYFVALMIKGLEIKMNSMATGGTFKEISKSAFCTLQIPLPSLEVQLKVVSAVQEEQRIIQENSKLIKLFELKIKDRMAKVWGE